MRYSTNTWSFNLIVSFTSGPVSQLSIRRRGLVSEALADCCPQVTSNFYLYFKISFFIILQSSAWKWLKSLWMYLNSNTVSDNKSLNRWLNFSLGSHATCLNSRRKIKIQHQCDSRIPRLSFMCASRLIMNHPKPQSSDSELSNCTTMSVKKS